MENVKIVSKKKSTQRKTVTRKNKKQQENTGVTIPVPQNKSYKPEEKEQQQQHPIQLQQQQDIPVFQFDSVIASNCQWQLMNQYAKPKQQLLAYTYFINGEISKYISVGYDTNTFQPSVTIHHIGESSITLTSMEWMIMFVYIDQIKTYLDRTWTIIDGHNTGIIQVTKEFTIEQHNALSDWVWFKKDDLNQITINGEEFSQIEHLADFFNTIIYRLKLSSELVKNYYNDYVDKCAMFGTECLSSSQYFVPAIEKNFNYNKLFIEIGIVCIRKNYCVTSQINF